jgi:mycothiol synthase
MTEDDLPAIAAFLADDEEQLFDRPSRIGIDDVRAWVGSSSLENRGWVYEEPSGGIAAVGWVQAHDEVGIAVGVVRRDAIGRGLGSELVERSEAALRKDGVSRIQQITLAADLPAPALLSGRGYREVRRFWEMTVELGDEPPSEPVLPNGLRIEPFSAGVARAFHAALEEAFVGHWEHTPEPFDEWWERQVAKHDHDPSLWFLVRDGGEVAAATRNDPERSGGGWIGALGVRPAWRGRGLAKALLLHSFREFHRRGQRRVGLGVDSENATGATHLYESVGMHVDQEQVVWEKVLA